MCTEATKTRGRSRTVKDAIAICRVYQLSYKAILSARGIDAAKNDSYYIGIPIVL